MPKGSGYICSWHVGDEAGLIHVCDGDNLVGDDVAFPFASCSSDLQATLKKKDIEQAEDCPPPAGALRVRFDFDIQNGGDLAVNVRPI
jgi:hypothetical protein